MEGGWERVMEAQVRVVVVMERAREEEVRVTGMEEAAVVAAVAAVVEREKVMEEEVARVMVVRVMEEKVKVMGAKEMAEAAMVKGVKARGRGARGWVAGWDLGEEGAGLAREGCRGWDGKGAGFVRSRRTEAISSKTDVQGGKRS